MAMASDPSRGGKQEISRRKSVWVRRFLPIYLRGREGEGGRGGRIYSCGAF